MKRNLFSIIIILILFVLSIFSLYQLRKKSLITENFNLILISIDTLRPDHMGIYGYSKNTTPNIDRWSQTANVYTNAYTVVPWTFSSFFALFTGTRPYAEISQMIKQIKNDMNRTTIPEILIRNKFKTAAFITNPVIGIFSDFFKKGFENFEFVDMSNSTEKQHINSYNYDGKNALEVTNKSIDWIVKNLSEKFFVLLHYTTPHIPYNPDKKYICALDKNCDLEKYSHIMSEKFPNSIFIDSCNKKMESETIDSGIMLYDAEILSVDEQVGRILTEIKNLDLNKKTVIIIYGDHGEGFDHDMFGHGFSLYNYGIKIPLIIKRPESSEGNRVDTLIDNRDILPSILDLLRIKYSNDSIKGNSFIYPAKQNREKYLYSSTARLNSVKLSVQDKDYKYIITKGDGCLYHDLHEEFYNLQTDKDEITNVIDIEKDKAKKYKESLINELRNDPELLNDFKNDPVTNFPSDTLNTLKKLGY